MRKRVLIFCIGLLQLGGAGFVYGQTKDRFAVIAYYSGKRPGQADSFEVEKLTHLIFSFCHLKGARLNVDRAIDSVMIGKLVGLKKKKPGIEGNAFAGGMGRLCQLLRCFFIKKEPEDFCRIGKRAEPVFWNRRY